jgi:hypothetical protein
MNVIHPEIRAEMNRWESVWAEEQRIGAAKHAQGQSIESCTSYMQREGWLAASRHAERNLR